MDESINMNNVSYNDMPRSMSNLDSTVNDLYSKVLFDSDDVLRSFEKAKVKSLLHHELVSSYTRIPKLILLMKDDAFSNVYQDSINHICDLAIKSTTALTEMIVEAETHDASNITELAINDMKKYSYVSDIVSCTEQMAHYNKLFISGLDSNNEFSQKIKSQFSELLYKHNVHLSKHDSDVHPLLEEAKSYISIRNTLNRNSLHKNGIIIENHTDPSIEENLGRRIIVTGADILNNYIIPLVDNTEHAFDVDKASWLEGNPIYEIRKSNPNIRNTLRVNYQINDAITQVTFNISDNGYGIPPHVQEKLFEKGASVTGEKGRGIALNSIREELRGLGGDITYTTTPARGTTFSIHIPYKEYDEKNKVYMCKF